MSSKARLRGMWGDICLGNRECGVEDDDIFRLSYEETIEVRCGNPEEKN